ncbi:MAG: amidohydrolase [Clostridia bacterium]|nr:amidohydrolase [Clostridia bacterium]
MILIQNGYIKPMAGDDIPGGSVLIGDDGKIAAVGLALEAPEGATVIDAAGRLVTPGCIDAHCHIGLDNEGMGWEGRDYNEIVDPCTPQMRAIDSINPQDEAFALAIRAGVTAACTGPGSANVVGGTFAAIKLTGCCVDKMIIKHPLAMKCAFGENPKRCYGQGMKKSPMTRMGTAALLRELLFKTQRYLADKEAGKNPAFDMKLEAMIPVIRGEIPLKAHAHRADDILTAIRVAREFGVGITLDHCTDGAVIAGELAEEGLPAFVGPTLGGKSKIELQNKSFDTPRILHEAGVPISIITDAPVIPLQYLPMCAGLAVNAGLPADAAWRAITIIPATQTGIGDRVGSLEPGKDGDVVIWTADPLTQVGAEAAVTVVDGRIVYCTETVNIYEE